MAQQKQTNTFTIIAVAAILILGAGFIIWAAFSSSPAVVSQDNSTASKIANPAIFEVSESTFDFGEISMAAGKVSHIFKVKNGGKEDVKIDRIYTSCMCTTAIFQRGDKKFGPFGMQGHGYIPKISQTLAPGEEAEVEVVFDPAAHGPSGIGYVERVVYLETSSGVQQIWIKATVKP